MREYTLSFVKANVYSLIVYLPIIGIYTLLYSFVYGWSVFGSDLLQFFTAPIWALGAIVVGTVLHESIHGISWWWLDDIPWKDIHFGFKWKVLTPYVHCPVPVEVSSYRWGVAMPGIVLGVIPYLVALLIGNGWLLGFGFFFSLAASGDILILWLLRKVEAGNKVQDHPKKVGCVISDQG